MSMVMSENVSWNVSRLRVTRLAVVSHLALKQVNIDTEFDKLLDGTSTLAGLPTASLPVAADLPVDTCFWGRIADGTGNLTTPLARPAKVRRRGVPLRVAGHLEVTWPDSPTAPIVRRASLELHVHPVTVVAIATVDLEMPAGSNVPEVLVALAELDTANTTATLGQASVPGLFAGLVDQVAKEACEMLGGRPEDARAAVKPHRLVSVIQGSLGPANTAMPAARSALHCAVHHMSTGTAAMPDPQNAFVRRWTGADYGYATTELLYMLETGSASVADQQGDLLQEVDLADRAAASAYASPCPRMNQSQRHRELTLLLAYLMSQVALLRASAPVKEQDFQALKEWARNAAYLLASLYGPSEGFRCFALAPQHMLASHAALEDMLPLRGNRGVYDNAAPLKAQYPEG